jgi:AcrR family transcriptional regulator
MHTKAKALSGGSAPNGVRGDGDGRAPARGGPSNAGTVHNGRQANGAQRMVEIQRARMLGAMVEECAEDGPAHVTVAGVVERAGVSRRTFYEVFDDCEGCLRAALEEGLRRVSERVIPAYRDGGRWSERIRDALIALLEFLEAEPVMGRLLIVGSLAAGPRAVERRREVLARIIAVVGEGRALKRPGTAESKATRQPSSLTAEGIVGGVLSILHARLSAEDPGELLELTGPLMSMIVLPYLGSAAANRELKRATPKRRQSSIASASDPLRDLGLRLTYRTVRALISVAEHPGASNREIGEAAGIADQGQMSKLLWRLERSGLVHNTGLGPGTGAPNIWKLTKRGEAIHAAIAMQEPVE